MGFNLQPAAGPFTLAAGASMRVWVWFGNPRSGNEFGDDKGAQWLMANPIHVPGSFPILSRALQVSDITKARDVWHEYDAETNTDYIDGTGERTAVRYEVTVTNVGSHTTQFTIQGGGNT